MKPAIFFDRDGTLIEDKDYLHHPEEVEIFPGAVAALRQLQATGFDLFIVSNQSGVGRGYFTMADVAKVHHHLEEQFLLGHVTFKKIYVAPEAPDQPSRGRKPSPQFLFDARDEFQLDLAQSYIVGDKLIDLECGINAGVKRSLLVRTGYGAQVERALPRPLTNYDVVDDVVAAAQWIMAATIK